MVFTCSLYEYEFGLLMILNLGLHTTTGVGFCMTMNGGLSMTTNGAEKITKFPFVTDFCRFSKIDRLPRNPKFRTFSLKFPMSLKNADSFAVCVNISIP